MKLAVEDLGTWEFAKFIRLRLRLKELRDDDGDIFD